MKGIATVIPLPESFVLVLVPFYVASFEKIGSFFELFIPLRFFFFFFFYIVIFILSLLIRSPPFLLGLPFSLPFGS